MIRNQRCHTPPPPSPPMNKSHFFFVSVGETFPLQWMLRKRLEEELSQNWPPKSRYSDDEDDAGEGTSGGDGGGAGGGAVAQDKHNSEVTRFAIEAICECTGVSAELAAYALQFSQVRRNLFLFFFGCRHHFGAFFFLLVPYGRRVGACVDGGIPWAPADKNGRVWASAQFIVPSPLYCRA